MHGVLFARSSACTADLIPSYDGAMASHLSSIGFRIEKEEDFARLAAELSRRAVEVPVKGGRYLRWSGGGGEQLWLQLNARRELIGMNPHFEGKSRVRVGVVARVGRPGETTLDGALHAWASPGTDSPEEGEYPFVFDVPDAAAYPDLEIPGIAEAQVAAFAHEASFFDSEDAFDASQEEDGLRLAARSFIPSGMFAGEKDDPPVSQAIFAGQVVESETRTNGLSGTEFWWVLVDTLGGRYDVVLDPTLLDERPVIGGFLSGTFWLSGRLLTYPRGTVGWFGQLLRGRS